MINFDLRGILHTQTGFISFQTLTKSQPCVYLCHKVFRAYKAVLYTKCLNNFHKFYNIEGLNILHNILTKKLNRTKTVEFILYICLNYLCTLYNRRFNIQQFLLYWLHLIHFKRRILWSGRMPLQWKIYQCLFW